MKCLSSGQEEVMSLCLVNSGVKGVPKGYISFGVFEYEWSWMLLDSSMCCCPGSLLWTTVSAPPAKQLPHAYVPFVTLPLSNLCISHFIAIGFCGDKRDCMSLCVRGMFWRSCSACACSLFSAHQKVKQFSASLKQKVAIIFDVTLHHNVDNYFCNSNPYSTKSKKLLRHSECCKTACFMQF